MLPYIITAVVSIIITALIVWFAAALYQKKSANSKIGNAEEKARGIIDEAVKTAEEKKRESMLEIKEETIRSKNELDKEIKEAIRKANQSSSGSSGGSSSSGVVRGSTVYVTPSGKKYHYSASCAGKNARATTLSAAQASGKGPCSKYAR